MPARPGRVPVRTPAEQEPGAYKAVISPRAERALKRLYRQSRQCYERATGASHPWNPISRFTGTRLAAPCGLTRAVVSLMKVLAGRESFIYHSQEREEEWIYIISGRGVAEIGDEE